MAGVVAYIDQHVQVGQETTAGTPVAANRQLQTLMYTSQDNPGPSLFHCHMQMHMDFGFMALFDYA